MEGVTGRADGGANASLAPTPRLTGFVPAGMLDWPGRVSATLFLSGCSLRCPYCHNAGLQRPTAGSLDWSGLVTHLRSKRSWLDGVVVTGGEPTEDPDLPSLLAALAEEGFAVKLDTNGSHPEILHVLLAEGLVDYVALDVKAAPANYASATGTKDIWANVSACIEMLVSRGITHEFRTTAYPSAVSLDDLPRIAEHLRGGTLYALQQFKPDTAASPEAREVRPYDPKQLHEAASACNRYLPTIVRGV